MPVSVLQRRQFAGASKDGHCGKSLCAWYQDSCSVVVCVLQREPSEVCNLPLPVAHYSVFRNRYFSFVIPLPKMRNASLLYIQLC